MDSVKVLLTEHDAENLSFDEIAQSAKVTRATLYNHFSSKEELLKEILLPALQYVTGILEEKNKKTDADFKDITYSLFELYSKYKQNMELVSCHRLFKNKEVQFAHRQFLDQFQNLMIAAVPEGYPFGLELSMKILSRIYLPVLKELSSSDQLELSLFHKIIKGALGL